MPPSFFAIRNFEKFQHYRDRRPPWIKLYASLLDDPGFFELSDAERYQLIGLFILASQTENKIPNKPRWIRHQLRATSSISLQRFIDAGWLLPVEQDASTTLACEHVASTTLADCVQDASPRARAESRDREEESRDREEESPPASSFGEFQNVILTPAEQQSLIMRFGHSSAWERIETLSAYLKSTGRKYKSHYATILTWHRRQGANGNGRRSTKSDRTREATEELLRDLDQQDRERSECGD